MAVTDFVSVMRGGEMVDHLKTKDTTLQQLAELDGGPAGSAGWAMPRLNLASLSDSRTSDGNRGIWCSACA